MTKTPLRHLTMKQFSSTKAAVTQMEQDFEKSSEKDRKQEQNLKRNLNRKFNEAEDLGLDATIESMCNMAEMDLTYEEFAQYYPLADELTYHLEDHMYALTYEKRMDKIGRMTADDLTRLL